MENSELGADSSRTYRRHGACRFVVVNVNVFNWQEDFEMRDIERMSHLIFSQMAKDRR
jgi:hypothetical protein